MLFRSVRHGRAVRTQMGWRVVGKRRWLRVERDLFQLQLHGHESRHEECAMKQLIGLILIVCGIALGAYVGVWWALIGGVVQFIEGVRAPQLIPIDIGIGMAKVLLCGLAFWLSAAVLIVPGWILATDK